MQRLLLAVVFLGIAAAALAHERTPGVVVVTTLTLSPTDSPATCNTGLAGSLYYDTSLDALCHCLDDGSPAWEAVDDAVVDTPASGSCG